MASTQESETSPPLEPAARAWPDYRAVWRWHFYAGLFCLPFVVILSFSGALYLFKPQVEAWNERAWDRLTISGAPAPASAHLAAALAAYPGATLSAYELPQTGSCAARVLLRHEGEMLRVYVHPESCAVLYAFPENQRFMRWMFRLHGELLLGDWGSQLVELAASWTIIMILTGLYLWWPRQARGWGGIVYPRLGGGGRMFWRDLHGVTGFWISALALFLLLSGLPWAKSWGNYLRAVRQWTGTAVARQDWSNSSAAGEQRPRKKSDGGHDPSSHGGGREAAPEMNWDALDAVVPLALGAHLHHPVQLAPAVESGARWTIKSQTANRPRRVTLTVDAARGEIIAREDFHSRHWIDKLVAIGIAAHEGQLFGWPNQLLGLLTALGLVLLCGSGIVLWWRRRTAGTLGAPQAGVAPRFSLLLTALIAALGIYLPLFGASLLLVLVLERCALRHLPGVKTWLGLRST